MLRFYCTKCVPVMLFLVSLTLASGFILASSRVVADDDTVIDEVEIVVPSSCTLSGVGMDSHSATINNGTYASDIGTTTIKAFCNDVGGFAIYAAGYTGDEVGGIDSTKLVGENNVGNISTGTATSGNSQWAMKLATNSGATYPITIESDSNGSFASYHIVPEDFVKVASRSASTDIGVAAVGSTLTTTYQVFISSTQAAGTYYGQVIYVLVHPSNHNAPVICNPNATTISEVVCMQDFSNVSDANREAIVDSMTPETQYTISDSRDGKTYTIAKFFIENDSQTNEPIYDVWMTQNLDLDLDASTTYTNLDTDIGYNSTTGTYDTATWIPARSTYTIGGVWCDGGHWAYDNGGYYCESSNTPESYDPGNLYWDGVDPGSSEADWQSYQNSCNLQSTPVYCDESLNPLYDYTVVTRSLTRQYHIGNYYNFAAAVAMNDISSYTVPSSLVDQSICPAGWALPRINVDDDSFYTLWDKAYGIGPSTLESIWDAPLYTVPSGSWEGYSKKLVGNEGYFWSAIVDGTYYSFISGYKYNDDSIWYNIGGFKSQGYSIRCMLRPVTTNIDPPIG
ncbi:hypothetical protein IJH24_00500 [Candidatus Saccharibacteria bacterium]|nr:hypothetical protein [Candidatus Saccharibacteria bacterium]